MTNTKKDNPLFAIEDDICYGYVSQARPVNGALEKYLSEVRAYEQSVKDFYTAYYTKSLTVSGLEWNWGEYWDDAETKEDPSCKYRTTQVVVLPDGKKATSKCFSEMQQYGYDCPTQERIEEESTALIRACMRQLRSVPFCGVCNKPVQITTRIISGLLTAVYTCEEI